MRRFFCSLFTLLILAGCFGVNRDIEVGDGEVRDSSQRTVNGQIQIGAEAKVAGDVQTVNGSIAIGPGGQVDQAETVNGKIVLGENARATGLQTVNGSVEIGPGAVVSGDVETVNGRLLAGEGAVIDGQLASINGQIRLQGATAGSLENVRGGMLLEAGSRVLGELRVKAGRDGKSDDPVLVEIHADCEVVGPLVFERPVRLRIHESARVGEIRGAEPEYFSG